MTKLGKILLSVGLGYIAYRLFTTQTVSGSLTEAAGNLLDDTMNAIVPGYWLTAGNAPQYVPFINQVESQAGIPANLLARVAYQETHFNDIGPGTPVSPAGAVGLFQLMPQFFPGAGANWQEDTTTAADYLLKLYTEFGDWQVALAAYNDGPGNVTKLITEYGVQGFLANAPTETQNYVTQIVADVPVPGSLVDTSGQTQNA